MRLLLDTCLSPEIVNQVVQAGHDVVWIGERLPDPGDAAILNEAHADRAELLRWGETAPRPPKTVFLTHGEPESSAALAAAVAEKFGVETIVPRMGETYDMA